ncbi:hypothetical protein V490_02457 [Pseudogymnoascus sp. VKM F-3557]|nr:hypothetical protein V490_02457 [Pseudogymnoascus sp. VKM F-3557]
MAPRTPVFYADVRLTRRAAGADRSLAALKLQDRDTNVELRGWEYAGWGGYMETDTAVAFLEGQGMEVMHK